jgi:hypothetical protein
VTGQAPLDWHALFHRFEATVDMPACLYYQELLQAFPDARVVLTVRDPDPWYASFLTLHNFVNRVRRFGWLIPRLRKMVHFADALLEKTFAGSLDRAHCIRVFNEHNEAVQRSVPPTACSSSGSRRAGDRSAPSSATTSPRGFPSHTSMRGTDPRGGGAAVVRRPVAVAQPPASRGARTPGVVAPGPARQVTAPRRDPGLLSD